MIAAIALLIWLNEWTHSIEWPWSPFYFPTIFLLLLAIYFLTKQAKLCASNSKVKTLFWWMMISILGGIGIIFLVYIIPIMLLDFSLFSTWIANTFCFTIFLSFVIGANHSELFSIKDWWFKIWSIIGFCILLLIFDVLFIVLLTLLLFNTIPPYHLPLSLVLIWIYLFFRYKIKAYYQKDSPPYPFTQPISLFHESLHEKNFIQKLNDLYDPLAIETIDAFFNKPTSSSDGLILSVSLPLSVDDQALYQHSFLKGYQLIGKNKGKHSFDSKDEKFISQLIEHYQYSQKLEDEKKVMLTKERERIMRDLHDDVAGDLLSLSHRVENKELKQQAQQALKNLRDIVYSIDDDQHQSLDELIANWRYETKQLTDCMGVSLNWPVFTFEISISINVSKAKQISRIFRELRSNALNNNTQNLIVTFQLKNNYLDFTIANDGVNQKMIDWNLGKGINSVKYRVKSIEGTIHWHQRNTYCEVFCRIPI